MSHQVSITELLLSWYLSQFLYPVAWQKHISLWIVLQKLNVQGFSVRDVGAAWCHSWEWVSKETVCTESVMSVPKDKQQESCWSCAGDSKPLFSHLKLPGKQDSIAFSCPCKEDEGSAPQQNSVISGHFCHNHWHFALVYCGCGRSWVYTRTLLCQALKKHQ